MAERDGQHSRGEWRLRHPVPLQSHQTMEPTTYGQMVKTELERQVSGAAPAPTPAASHAVFDDSLRWANWSWGTTVNPDVLSPMHSGSRSLGVTYNNAWAGLSLHNPGLDTAPYSHLQFAIHPNSQGLSGIEVLCTTATTR